MNMEKKRLSREDEEFLRTMVVPQEDLSPSVREKRAGGLRVVQIYQRPRY